MKSLNKDAITTATLHNKKNIRDNLLRMRIKISIYALQNLPREDPNKGRGRRKGGNSNN